MCLSFASCGGSGAGSMDKYISSIQSQMESMKDTLDSSGMDVELIQRGNSLVYRYQFTTDIGDTDVVKQTLESGMEQMASTFQAGLKAVSYTHLDVYKRQAPGRSRGPFPPAG